MRNVDSTIAQAMVNGTQVREPLARGRRLYLCPPSTGTINDDRGQVPEYIKISKQVLFSHILRLGFGIAIGLIGYAYIGVASGEQQMRYSSVC